MARTNPETVRATIQSDTSIELSPFIRTANALTDYVEEQDRRHILTDDLLLEIETYLAAHFYALRDQQFESRSTGAASGKFQTADKGKRLEATDWGQQAMALDVTGTLATLNDRKITPLFQWLGTPLSQQRGKITRDGHRALLR